MSSIQWPWLGQMNASSSHSHSRSPKTLPRPKLGWTTSLPKKQLGCYRPHAWAINNSNEISKLKIWQILQMAKCGMWIWPSLLYSKDSILENKRFQIEVKNFYIVTGDWKNYFTDDEIYLQKIMVLSFHIFIQQNLVILCRIFLKLFGYLDWIRLTLRSARLNKEYNWFTNFFLIENFNIADHV